MPNTNPKQAAGEKLIKFYKPKHGFCGEVIAEYKGVTAILARDIKKKWVSIYGIESNNKGKGEAQDFIKELKKIMPKEFILWSSAPLNNTWKHICDKYNLRYAND
jgi:hypothetical protein